MNTLIIDNFDSFTYNLAYMLVQMGVNVTVKRNNSITINEIDSYDKILISPGPGIPSESRFIIDVIKEYASKKPIIGVCLGHQAIAEAFGGKIFNMPIVSHGTSTTIEVLSENEPLFNHLDKKLKVGLYHSWAIDKNSLPDCIEITSVSLDGTIMSISHKSYNVKGIQFHPESILTKEGFQLIKNWVEI